ncbi:uncharacterized protein [Henckelia pumila]|uniref:uncharacterized protein n=1 Tax=Henckelia pumila TaxID=405737 RepID=UPI003C6DD533
MGLFAAPSKNRTVRSLSPIGSFIASSSSLVEWWNHLVVFKEAKEIAIAATLLWSIWRNRNNVVWNGTCSTANHVYLSALDLLSQWNKAQLKIASNLQATQLSCVSTWQRPPEHFLKCNVDAAVHTSPPHVGFGCIIRDSHGIVLAATQGRMHGNYDPAMAEALAIREALSWIRNLHLSSIIMESDALLIIEALNSTEPDFSNVNLIIEDCK